MTQFCLCVWCEKIIANERKGETLKEKKIRKMEEKKVAVKTEQVIMSPTIMSFISKNLT